jgi:hypothetical protein
VLEPLYGLVGFHRGGRLTPGVDGTQGSRPAQPYSDSNRSE